MISFQCDICILTIFLICVQIVSLNMTKLHFAVQVQVLDVMIKFIIWIVFSE